MPDTTSELSSVAPTGLPESGTAEKLSLGQAIRAARQARGLTIDEIARSTKIGRRLLESIERDEYQLLPGGIFNRAFIRQYARQVGLDGEWGVHLYESAIHKAGEGERAARRAGVRLEMVVLTIGVILALLLGMTFWYFWWH